MGDNLVEGAIVFGKNWLPAEATILQVHTTKTTGDGMVSIHEFAADVRTPEGEVFRARIGEPKFAMDFFPPSAGMVVRVEYEAKSRAVRFDKDDPRLSVKRRKQAKDASFEALLRDPPEVP